MLENQSVVVAFQKEKGKIIHVKEAANGLSCNCACLDCNDSLEAIQGPVRKWHFRHVKNRNCPGGLETTLHKLGKQIICEHYEIEVPSQGKIQYSNPIAEKQFKEFQPDVTAGFLGELLFFEIIVSNPVNEAKAIFYKKEKIRSISIDLSYFITNPPSSYEEVEKKVIEQLDGKNVIFWKPPPIINNSGLNSKGDSPMKWFLGLGLMILSLIGFRQFLIKKKPRKTQYFNKQRRKV